MLSLTLVALSRGQTLWLEMDMRGASVERACKRSVARPSLTNRFLPLAADASTHPFPRASFVKHKWDSAPQHHLSSWATLASCVLLPTHSSERWD